MLAITDLSLADQHRAKRVVMYEVDGELYAPRNPERPGLEPGTPITALVKIPKDPSACWSWQSKILQNGYGTKTHNGRDWLAHRWVYTMLLGPIPKGMVLDHICSNRACVNPHHLRAVTQAENCRSGLGAILVADDVKEIKAALDNGVREETLAARFGVSRGTISSISQNKSWR